MCAQERAVGVTFHQWIGACVGCCNTRSTAGARVRRRTQRHAVITFLSRRAREQRASGPLFAQGEGHQPHWVREMPVPPCIYRHAPRCSIKRDPGPRPARERDNTKPPHHQARYCAPTLLNGEWMGQASRLQPYAPLGTAAPYAHATDNCETAGAESRQRVLRVLFF
jgi:hypothetical protein